MAANHGTPTGLRSYLHPLHFGPRGWECAYVRAFSIRELTVRPIVPHGYVLLNRLLVVAARQGYVRQTIEQRKSWCFPPRRGQRTKNRRPWDSMCKEATDGK